jgi:predicted CoA-binding protein
MVSRKVIDDFIAQKSLAICGVSRDGKKGFGNITRKALAARGYTLHLVHPEVDAIDGQACARALSDVASKVGGVLLVTPPEITRKLVQEAAEAGIQRVWMQQGAEDPEAIRFCEERGMAAVHGHCIMMFLPKPGFGHVVHRFLKRIAGSLPV